MDIYSLMERYPNQEKCIEYLEHLRWGVQMECPICGSSHVYIMRPRHKCYDCQRKFTVTVGTIFHHTQLPLPKWFLTVSLMLNSKKGISTPQLARHIGVKDDTAWSMQMRIRHAMTEPVPLPLSGILEMDETYMYGRSDATYNTFRNTGKIPIIGIVERGGRVAARATTSDRLKQRDMEAFVTELVDTKGSELNTDGYRGYSQMGKILPHRVIIHWKAYVIGDSHTNTIESFWASFKRGLRGQYHYVSGKYLQMYIDEFCYRHNIRHMAPERQFEHLILRCVNTELAN